jgi:flagellar hook protein FlgE
MGWQEDPQKPGTIIKDTVTPLKIMSAENMTSEPEQTTQAYLSGVIDKNSTQLTSTNGLIVNVGIYDELGYSYVAKFAIKSTTTDGTYSFEPVDLIDSNGFSLMHSKSESGYEKTGYDADGGPQTTSPGTYPKTMTLDRTTLTYDPTTGKSLEVDAAGNDKQYTLTIGEIPAFTSTIKLGAGKSTMYDNKGTSTIKGNAGDYDGNYAGRKVGEMSGVAIAQDGKITATYDNGTTKLLGQIAVANFANPSGLEKIGDNLYQSTPNSGAFDGIGEDITAGSGSLSTGVLEMSNVDLSAEFTDMITTQRGFQANSRIITVSDSMLEELTNLKR